MNNSKDKDTRTFINYIIKLKPIEFIGITKLLGVNTLNEDKNPRPLDEVLDGVLHKFSTLSHERRKEILHLVQQTIKEGNKKCR